MSESPSQKPPPSLPASALWIPLAMLAAGLLAFAAISFDVLHNGPLARADLPLAAVIHHCSRPWTIILGSAISALGEFHVLGPIALAVGILLAYRRRWREFAVWTLALIGSAVIDQSLKAAFAIPRPGAYTYYAFTADDGYSYPSGHAMGVTIAAGTLALILAQSGAGRRHRWWLALAAAGLGLLESAALVSIGVHYLTDVAAALAISLAWLGILKLLLPPTRMAADERG